MSSIEHVRFNDFVFQSRNGTDKLRKSRYIFGCLCQATIHMNHIFSFTTLVTICSKLITVVYSLFSLIYQLLKPNHLMDEAYLMNIVGVSIDILVIMVYFTAADMPINQVSLQHVSRQFLNPVLYH